MTVTTLADLTRLTGLDVLDHLERQVSIPVIDGLQAQGDLIVIPIGILSEVAISDGAHWNDVPPSGVELLRGGAGGNPHTLAADHGACRWTTGVHDPVGLALGALETSQVAYLIHPEHGGTGIAPGTYVVRRQRERLRSRRPGDGTLGYQAVQLVAD
ncbi:hypothetical protein [Spirillospora sp. CA-294931]|uniref:hypothetical protein n=1 Tax=Spirillospora sp. CA-294931 TaxID=3240042 RepID=UPI003D8C2C5E